MGLGQAGQDAGDVQQYRQRFGVVAQSRQVGFGQAHQRGNRAQRQRDRQIAHDIEAALARFPRECGIDQRVGQGL